MHDARRNICRAGNPAKCGAGGIRSGKSEVRAIECIEHFPAELPAPAFAVTPVLRDTDIGGISTGSGDQVARRSAKGARSVAAKSVPIEILAQPVRFGPLVHIQWLAGNEIRAVCSDL